MAFVVPMACEQVPMATPWAMGSVTRKRRMSRGAAIAPRIPVRITAATVTGTMPPSVSETAMAIGVVTDLGSMVATSASSRPKALHSRKALPMEARLPIRHPSSTGRKYCLSTRRWL